MVVTTNETAVVEDAPSRPIISWGAIFASLAIILASSFLLILLGAAIGVSIADVTDLDAIGNGLGWGAAIWTLLTTLVVFFIGGLIAAHLSGRMSDASGLMHGVTVWAVASILLLLLDLMIISTVARGTVGAAQTVVSATTSLGGMALSGAQSVGGSLSDLATSQYTDEVRAELKQRTSAVLAEQDAEGGSQLSQEDIRQSINDLDEAVLSDVVSELLAGDVEGAQQTLAAELELSEAQITDLINDINEQIDELAETPEAQQVIDWAQEQLDEMAQQFSEISGPTVSRQEIRDSLQQLDIPTTMSITQALVTGDIELAKQRLASNTDLTESEVSDIIDGVDEELSQGARNIVEEFNQTMETASDYAQMILWLYFFTAALSLGAAALGGYVSASRDRRVYATGTANRTYTSGLRREDVPK